MIKHHPDHSVLKAFVEGDLPVSVSVIVASHVEMCAECQALTHQLTEIAAFQAFALDDVTLDDVTLDDFAMDAEDDCFKFDTPVVLEQAEAITRQPVMQDTAAFPVTVTEIDVSGNRVTLPRAMQSISLKAWKGFKKISRARLNLEDEQRRSSLLHIAPGGQIPHHSHQGFEITLLLQGSFEDEYDTYHAGDFIWLDANHTHAPRTTQGCICLTVSDNALRFTHGVSQLLNPLGTVIY